MTHILYLFSTHLDRWLFPTDTIACSLKHNLFSQKLFNPLHFNLNRSY